MYLSDDYSTYIKSICPSGGHGRGYRPALQNRPAARHVQLQLQTRKTGANPREAATSTEVRPFIFK